MNRLLCILLCSVFSLSAGDKIPTYTNPKVGEYFKDWLLCGPFPNPLPEGIKEYRNDETSLGFYRDYLIEKGGESKIRPVQGMIIKHPDGGKIAWRRYHGYLSLIPLDDILQPNEGVVAYAACTILCSETTPVALSVTSNDGVRVWQNGLMILDHMCGGTEEPDRDLIPMVLQKGENNILLKIAQGGGKWSFQFRLLDLAQTAAQMETRKHLFSRPQISETETSWEIFVGQKHKIELLGSNEPAVVEILAPDQKQVLARFHTRLGKTLSIAKDSLRLNHGLHTVLCHVRTNDGDVHTLRSELPVGPSPSMLQTSRLFKTIPTVQDSAFLSRQIRAVSQCLESHMQQDLESGNVPPMSRWKHNELCASYKKWREQLQTAPSPYHRVFPQPREIRLGGGRSFLLPPSPSLFDSTFGVCQADLDRMRHDLGDRLVWQRQPQGAHIVLTIDTRRPWASPEAYTLSVREAQIRLSAASPAGLHNGLVTLRLLVLTDSSLPEAEVFDYPAQAHRCAFHSWPVPMTEQARVRLYEAIDLKYNEIVVYTGAYFQMDDPHIRNGLQEYFDLLRRHHVEPIPTVWLTPSIAQLEGSRLVDEPADFVADTCRFDFQCLVDLESSRPRLHARPGGGTVYTPGVDYEIVSTTPPVLRRLTTGRLPAKETVFLDADIVDLRNHRFAKACPSEEEVYLLFAKNIERVIHCLQPKKIHVNHDEIGIVNSDSRCHRRDMPDDELIAYQINRMHEIIKNCDRRVDMIMWADAVNPYHNAGKKNLEKTCDLLNRDIIMAHWYYSAENYEQVDLLERGAKFFIDRGFRTYGCPWDDLVNHQAWENVLANYRSQPLMYGLMHTQWSGRNDGLAQTAASNWEDTSWLRK
ncbi:MAG TPA: glycoside hydrolase family 20 zincin-like fold domain-containing protein [bacterium]|nr:glycoside hydrolase family 20 zincin-like fold domain-containing protein [bacterium]